MADVTVKMGVSGISQFKSGINDAQASVKTFDAALKANEKQMKATGNAENYMQAQTSLLNGKLKEQEKIVKNAEQALKQMEANGVKTTSAAYQNMQRKLIEAQSAMMDTQAELDNLGAKAEDAGEKADKLGEELGGLNKKVSLEQVTGVVDKLTQGLENAAKKAIDLGQQIWDTVMDSARRADDTATMAEMYGIDLQTFKQMQALVASGLDTSVDAMLTAQDKLTKGVGKGTQEVMDDLQKLGLAFSSGKDDAAQLITDDTVELFWKAGKALMEMDDAFDKEATAQTLFGRSWKELKPLFDTYDSLEDYNKALEQTSVSSEEATVNAAELADRVASLESTWTELKDEVIGAVAGPLAKAAETLESLLARVLEYLKTPEGKKALDDLGKAVEGLFSDLSEIDPEKVVEGFSTVFKGIVKGVQWLYEHKQDVVDALKAIVIGWGALKLTGGALQIVTLVNGIKGMTASSAAAAGSTAGASWAGAFATAAMKAAPFLVFLYTLLNPASTATDDQDVMFDKEGNLTTAGQEAGMTEEEVQETMAAEQKYKDERQAVMDATGLTRKQIETMQYFWSFMTDVRDNPNATEYQMEQYNWYGQKLSREFEGQEKQLAAYAQKMEQLYQSGERNFELGWSFFNINQEGVEVPLNLEAPENAAEDISQQVGDVIITGVVKIDGVEGVSSDWLTEGSDGSQIRKTRKKIKLPGKANGIWSVPFDGYAAVLHKGESVMPAREAAASRNFSSNLYVESMIMNNGTDADGLAAAMAAAQRRTMRGYGS